MTNKHCILVIFIAIILIFYAGPAGPIGLSFTERTNHLKPYHKAGKALTFCGQKIGERKDECSSSREGGVCDWRSWVHSIVAGEALAPPWVHC